MKKRVIHSILTLALVLLAASTALAFGTDWVAEEDLATKLTRETVTGGYGIVKTDELKQWIDQGKPMLVVDTMPFEDSYKKEHIPGAVQFEFPIEEVKELDEKTKADFLTFLGSDMDRTLVFYCGFTKCGRSHNGAMWALKLGYKNVYRSPGGIKAWDQRDFPMEAVK